MAKDVITRFKLETTGFDSKIKEAAKELSAYSKTATQAKEGFNQFTKANVDAAKALGTMATSTTNVKDRVKELVGAYNDAAKAYEALSDEQKQSDWAKALAGSLTQLQQRIKETKAEIQGLNNSMGDMGGGGIFSGIGSKMEGALAVFGGNLMTKAAGAVAQLGSEMADMVKQGVEMAKAGEGVRIAFERLGNGQILDGLREATHGTVTDLELMKAAVKFNDFKLPVEELGTMLAFAQQKAKDMGQSVDYMVDSIVTGLGRKSLMILDNLGLSASEIKEKMAETGDMTKAVGEIIREQMSKAGDYVETAADRAAKANVSLQNKMEELGRKFAPLEEASNNFWTSMKIGILDVVGGPLATLLNKLTEAGRLMNAYGQMGGSGKVGRMTSNLAGASEGNRQSVYQQQQAQFWKYINPREQQIKDIRAWQSGDRNEALQKRIGAITDKYGSLDVTKIQAEVDAAKKMLSEYQQAARQILSPVKADIDTKGAEQNVESLKVKLIELEAQRKKAIAAGDTDLSKNLTKQINQVKSDIKGLGGTTTNTHKNLDAEQQVQKKINDLLKEALTADANRQGEIRQQVAELQKQQEKYKDIKNLALGILPKDKEAVFTIDGQLSEETKKNLREIQGVTIDDKAITVRADTQKAMQKVQELIGQVSTTTLQMKVAPPDLDKLFPDMSKENYNTGYAGSMKAKIDSARQDFALSPTNFDTINSYISGIKNALKDADLGSDLYNSLTEQLKDATTMSTLLQEMMERGINGADLTSVAEKFKAALLDGDVPDDKIKEYVDKLNEQIKNASGIELSYDEKTGDVKDKDKKKGDKDVLNGSKQLVSGLSQVACGLQQMGVKLPEEVQQVLGVVQGLMTVIEGVNTVIGITQTAALTANTTAMIALTTALWANTASSIIPFAGGGIVKAAMGTIVGNSYSGDNLRGISPDGQLYGLNAGEVVLNKSQVGNIASQLGGGGLGNLHLETYVSGRDLRIVLNNESQGRLKGKYVTSNNVR